MIMKDEKERGNMVIEASITMTIAVVMVGVLIHLGLFMYQKNLMSTVATEAAVRVANVYGTTYRDPVYGYMDDSEFYKTDLYRYVVNLVTSSQNEIAEEKAEWYSLYRLKKGELTEFEDIKVEVEIIQKPGTIIQHQVVVTIESEFDMPLTAIWGGDNSTTYTVVGRADCVDLLDYFNTIGTIKETVMSKIDKLTEHLSKILSIFDFSSMEG